MEVMNLSITTNNGAVDGLVMHGSRASAAATLTKLSQNIIVLMPNEFRISFSCT